MSVRDPGTSLRTPDPRMSASSTPAGPTADVHSDPAAGAPVRPGPAPRRAGPVADRPRTKADPTVARLAAGALGIAATAALVSTIAGGSPAYASSGAITTTVAVPAPTAAPAAAVPVRHVTKVVTLPSNATPPPRKIIYATPVPAPPQQVVVVRTTQSGKVLP